MTTDRKKNPGDEARPGSPQRARPFARTATAAARLNGDECRACGGTGKIVAIVGDA